MTIRALRILPPLAIGRLGSADEPLDNYTVEDNPDHPLDFRRIKGAETLIVNEDGTMAPPRSPETISFRHGERIRPVAPFLEVFADTGGDELVPLTKVLLRENRLKPENISWHVTVANRKVFRRTADESDIVCAAEPISDHLRHRLKGTCKNFIDGAVVDFGDVRYIVPNDAFPQIRLRFTPAHGLIYGPHGTPPDPAIPPQRAVYDTTKGGRWYHFQAPDPDVDNPPGPDAPFFNETLPPSLFAIVRPAPSWLHDNIAISRGYLDDTCDGFVTVILESKDKTLHLEATARICSGPPVLVPDALFVRTLADDLDQALHGPAVPEDEPFEVTRARAEEIVRRAYETVRFLNVAVMNGNPVKGRPPLSLDTMPAEEAFDTGRLERPVMAEGSVDTLAILALHQQVFAALRGGSVPWFLRLMRQPEEAADYTDHGRRKMPALMCGADNNYLALTHRQIDTIRAAVVRTPFPPSINADVRAERDEEKPPALTPRNVSAQLHHPVTGNPPSSRPVNAVANCCPGLELDFRAVWRRLFEHVVLREYDSLVIHVDQGASLALQALKGHRLLRVAGVKVIAQRKGPSPANPDDSVVLSTDDNPEGVAPLEWSNALAQVLHGNVGKTVECDFTADKVWTERQWWDDKKPPPHISVELTVRPLFDEGTAVISRTLAEAGELTQGLCSPWQNDYRECSCYYWAAARPDYVNVTPSPTGMSTGDNWLQKDLAGTYVPDDYKDTRLILYDDLFAVSIGKDGHELSHWEKWLRFVIGGKREDAK